MQRKNFPLGEGGWGEEGSDEGSEEKSCENFVKKYFDFFKGKIGFDQSCSL